MILPFKTKLTKGDLCSVTGAADSSTRQVKEKSFTTPRFLQYDSRRRFLINKLAAATRAQVEHVTDASLLPSQGYDSIISAWHQTTMAILYLFTQISVTVTSVSNGLKFNHKIE